MKKVFVDMTTRLTLIRHGQTSWNGIGRYQGHAPIPLSERGKAQAKCLAAALAEDRLPAVVYSSDLVRCRQTAAPLVDALNTPVFFDVRLREMDYGNWQGLTRQEMAEMDKHAFARYRADPFNVPVPGGESQRMLASRVLAALDDILATNAGEHILIVAHGGSLREILRHYGLWSGGLPAPNASRSVLDLHPESGGAVPIMLGDLSHLPHELRPDQRGTAFIA